MDNFRNLIDAFPKATTAPRPFQTQVVRPNECHTIDERLEALIAAGWNVFNVPARYVSVDLLSDSGTSAMDTEQMAGIARGDEAYAFNRGYEALMAAVADVFGNFVPEIEGVPTSFLFHQGRAAEHALFSLLPKDGRKHILVANAFFDTTLANIEANGMEARDFPCPELLDPDSQSPFKGNIDVKALDAFLKTNWSKVPLVFLTITNNTGGGQPVSFENITAVHDLCRSYDIPFFFDACRFAENAWFIKRFEEGFGKNSVAEIVKAMFEEVDGFTISFKKDSLGSIGGGIFVRMKRFYKQHDDLLRDLRVHQFITEGHYTYGGMSGKELMALEAGLRASTDEAWLTHRITQVQRFGEAMAGHGVPIITPVGGSAVYLKVNEFFEGTGMPPTRFGGVGLANMLFLLYGHRACELGYFAFGKYDKGTKKHTFPEHNLVRFAVPRRVYEDQDLRAVADAVGLLYHNRDSIPQMEVTSGLTAPLRHFSARLEPVGYGN